MPVVRLPSAPNTYSTTWANQYTKMLEQENQQLWNALQNIQAEIDEIIAGGLTLNVGTTAISNGTAGRILFDNTAVLGEKAVTGTGDVVLATSPTLVTPALGTVASGNIAACTGFPTATGATTFLTGNVALNNTANYFAGPNTGSIGASGQTWLLNGVACINNTAAAAQCLARIFDGTTAYVNAGSSVDAANREVAVPIGPLVVTLTGATTFTLQARSPTNTSGNLLATSSSGGTNLATFITAVRLS